MAGRGLQQGSRIQVPVIDFAEPPLQAEIIISSSMTESLILHVLANAYIHARARTHGGYGGGDKLLAPALHDEDVLVANRGVWQVIRRRTKQAVQHTYGS